MGKISTIPPLNITESGGIAVKAVFSPLKSKLVSNHRHVANFKGLNLGIHMFGLKYFGNLLRSQKGLGSSESVSHIELLKT